MIPLVQCQHHERRVGAGDRTVAQVMAEIEQDDTHGCAVEVAPAALAARGRQGADQEENRVLTSTSVSSLASNSSRPASL